MENLTTFNGNSGWPYAEKVLLTPADVAAQRENLVLIDVSDPHDFKNRHIPQAHNIPDFWTYRALEQTGGLAAMGWLLKQALQSRGVDGSQPIVFTEQTPETGFGRSCRALYMAALTGLPLNQLHILDGGNQQWQLAGLPLASGDESHSETANWRGLPQPANLPVLTLSETRRALADGLLFIDVRNLPEFEGLEGAPYAITEGEPAREVIIPPGRIPGARGLLWADVFECQGERIGQFKPQAALQELFRTVGCHPDQPVIIYCFKGARSSAVLLALHLSGFHGARMYFAGWNEWARVNL